MSTIQNYRMIRISILIISLCSFSAHQAVKAQTPTSTPATRTNSLPDEESLHQELRGLKTVYENAVNSGDFKSLAPMFGAQSSGVVSLNKEFHTLPEMEKIYSSFLGMLGSDPVYRISLNPERSLIFGDIAVARGTSDEYIKSNGHEFKYQTRWSAVLRRENGQWVMINSQVTMDPFHNSVTQFLMTSIKRIYGAGGLVIGLFLGTVLGFLLWGRSKKR